MRLNNLLSTNLRYSDTSHRQLRIAYGSPYRPSGLRPMDPKRAKSRASDHWVCMGIRPWRRQYCEQSACDLCCIAVHTCDCTFTLAPFWTRTLMTSSWPASDAMCRAVLPFYNQQAATGVLLAYYFKTELTTWYCNIACWVIIVFEQPTSASILNTPRWNKAKTI